MCLANLRNEICFEKVTVHPDVYFARARDLLVEYEKANSCKGRSSKRGNVKWQPPLIDVVKFNVDAPVDINVDRVGLGLVARNSDGKVLKAASRSVWPLIGVERAEIDGFL